QLRGMREERRRGGAKASGDRAGGFGATLRERRRNHFRESDPRDRRAARRGTRFRTAKPGGRGIRAIVAGSRKEPGVSGDAAVDGSAGLHRDRAAGSWKEPASANIDGGPAARIRR